MALAALVGVAGYAVRDDLRKLSSLQGLEVRNESVHDYNYSRNILVRHLTRDANSGLARLKGYAAWMDTKTEKGVVVFTPEGGGPGTRSVVKVDLGDLRRRVAHDIQAMEGWTPPPPMKDYDGLRFETGELAASRLPVGLMFALALASVAVWSILANRNLVALEASARCSRALAVVACWLVPVANLYLPSAVMGDIWQGSDPRALGKPRRFRLPVVGLWWLTLLATISLLAFAVLRMIPATGPTRMVSAVRYALYADLGMIVVAVLTLGLVVTASWNQARRYRLVRKTIEELGPAKAWQSD